jgi:hypothetical protein
MSLLPIVGQDLQRHTPDTHPDYPHLKEAAKQMTNMAHFIDQSKDQYEASKSLVEVERQVIDLPNEPDKVCSTCGHHHHHHHHHDE